MMVVSDGGLIITLADVILEAGPTNVLQVITHLGHFSRGFESITEARFPHIFWSHCTSHSINLLMEEIAELDWMKAVVSCARGIDQLISTYRRSSSCLVIDTTKESSDPLSLKFAPSYALVKRIFETKQALQEEVVGEEWKRWKLTTPEDVSSIEAVIFGDDFWGRAHLMLQLCEPFMRLLATFDIKKSIMGDVYYWWVQSLEAVRSRGIDEVTVNQLELLAENRWDVLFSPLHAAGYILNPRYFGRGQSKKKTLMRGWKATVERYESDSATRLLLREQLSAYWRLQGSLGEADAMECRDKMDPVAWWENFGFETPNLQTLAIKILSQVSCVEVCRESWQCDNLPCREAIKRSAVERGEDIEDLVFVRNNLRLQSQKL
ncbi:hypothetical protein Nepgr_000320 [Nepenthes gracilis]|uniref:DUF659 domain-containing protein n=1 Tax=Nepenthes gracilis TaxID=150966 RepID=A0AAD3P2Y1_NEPGR|nr:hypothetical protein Nepgr_000320 [Nepenthes gracilis]